MTQFFKVPKIGKSSDLTSRGFDQEIDHKGIDLGTDRTGQAVGLRHAEVDPINVVTLGCSAEVEQNGSLTTFHFPFLLLIFFL